MRSLTILGSTGSIGQNTLDVISGHLDKLEVVALTAHQNAEKLIEQALRFKPKKVAIADDEQYLKVKDALSSTQIEVLAGAQAITDIASEPVDVTMAAIVGMAGLEPTLAAIKNSKVVAFASKECLVSAGNFMMQAVAKAGAKLLPVDSEHNAIYQVFEEANRESVQRLILTASGGPFLKTALSELYDVTPQQAVNHPNWSMGMKISVDSATMMNKALEVIEAHYLFGMPADKIDVLIHPQSIIHSMVEYGDGSVLAQMGAPDMRTPISYCLGYPDRIASNGQRLDFLQLKALTFEEPDLEKFPSIQSAYDALKAGQGACVAMNAANEVLVGAFLSHKIGYMDIVSSVNSALHKFQKSQVNSLEDVVLLDQDVREYIESEIKNEQKNKVSA